MPSWKSSVCRKQVTVTVSNLPQTSTFEGGMRYIFGHTPYQPLETYQDEQRKYQNYDIKKIVIVGGSESWRITDFISKNNIPIILERIHRLPNYEDDDIDQPFKTPKILKDAGILFCLDYQGDMERMGSRNLPFLAGTTVNFGLNKEEALSLISLNPAKILGISDRTGTLETGKDANLFVSSGDILDVFSHNIELAFLMGKKINLTNHQTNLYNKYLKQ